MSGTCSWCKRPLPSRRRRFCSDLCRRRGQKAERVTENGTYAGMIRRQITSMGVRASEDLYALGWLAGAVDHARSALAMAVDGCRARGYSDAEIAAALGVTRQAVWKRFPRQPKVDTGTAGSGVAG
jgi:DNA-directed RNA polymerase specialized sigma24 family protein